MAWSLAACGGGDSGPDTGLPLGTGPNGPLPIPIAAPVPVPPEVSASPAFTLVLLDANGQAGASSLNANGQVAFTSATPAGPRARFFDGVRVQVVAGDAPARAVAANDAGQVVGQLEPPLLGDQDTHAFFWTAAAPETLAVLETQAGTSTVAEGVNASGQVAGTATVRNVPAAFRWIPPMPLAQGLPPIGAPLSASPLSLGLFINASGAVAGVSSVPNGQVHAALWLQPGLPARDLGTLGGPDSSVAGLNDANQVVGQADLAGGAHHASIWSEGAGLRDLGTLGGPNSAARAVNANGWVIGTSDTADGSARAFVWRAGTLQSLGTLGGRSSAATAIDATGRIGGHADTADGTPHAFLWTEAGGMVDLNTLVASASVLRDVVALGQDGSVLARAGGGLVLLRPQRA